MSIEIVLCWIGRHRWGEVQTDGELKLVGPDVLFMTFAVQDGHRTCKQCGKRQEMQRFGLCGVGCENPDWIAK